jgi:YtoQ family protein
VVRFGEQYRQWNAAFDAGYAAALGKPLITLHPPEHDHALNTVMSADLLFESERSHSRSARVVGAWRRSRHSRMVMGIRD